VPEADSSGSISPELAQIWDEVRAALRTDVTEVTFHIWLEPLRPAAFEGGTLYVRAPEHVRTWVEERFHGLISDAARRALSIARVEIVDHDWEPAVPAPDTRPAGGARGAGASGLNPRYTFDQFVICDANRLAHAAALAVAEMPGQAYNPLFIHGRPGLGKTHLLHAIGNYVQSYGGGLTVRYATVEEFTSGYVTAVRTKEMSAFRERFRDADILLVDDVQFLAEKLKTEEEFFHTFNALYDTGSQLVVTSDRRPRDIDQLAARLRERFEHGLIAELEVPDLPARMAILRKRAKLDALDAVPDETLTEVASHVTTSVRQLEGALIRVVAYASLRGDKATPDLAREVLERLHPSAARRQTTVDDIQVAAAEAFDITKDELLARGRTPRVAFARQVAMYLSRELTAETLPAIGRHFGGRNHTTVLHAHKRIAQEMSEDSATLDAVESLRRRLDETEADRS
jgi:chromosomal replication initiator protein